MKITDSEKHNRTFLVHGVPEYSEKYGPLEVCVNYTKNDQLPDGARGVALDDHVVPLLKKAAAALDALQAWKEFWDDMPKGQMGKLAFDVGLLNDAFLKMNAVLAKKKKKE